MSYFMKHLKPPDQNKHGNSATYGPRLSRLRNVQGVDMKAMLTSTVYSTVKIPEAK